MLNFNKVINWYDNWRREKITDVRSLFACQYIKVFFIVTLAVNICLWAAVYYMIAQMPNEQIALHYNVDFGIDYYGTIGQIYIMPALGLIIFIFNCCLLLATNRRQDAKILHYLLMTTSLSANLILAASLISIYLINSR